MGELNECLSTDRRHSAVSPPSDSCIRFGAGTVQSWPRLDRGADSSAVKCDASRNRESRRKVRLSDAERGSSVQRWIAPMNDGEHTDLTFESACDSSLKALESHASGSIQALHCEKSSVHEQHSSRSLGMLRR